MKRAALISLAITILLAFSFLLFNKITGFSASESSLNNAKEMRIVTKIIDGDTIIVSGGETIRLLGMDTDEKGQPCYKQAKQRLENLTLNKEVMLKAGKEDKDIYGRSLRYIFLGEENINVLLVKEGLAIARLENSKLYAQEIKDAEAYAIQNKIGCKWANS